MAQVGVVGDRASSGAARADPHGRGVKGSTFLDGFPIFSRWGSFGKRAVDGWDAAGSASVPRQKQTSKIRLRVEVISKITGGSWQKFLRIAEYFVMFFAFLNGFDTLR
ncbi:MAG: hypothetical protein JGK17_31300 [Microcoleus sp. PH2017_10_PVI_O_A]|uniref:hypothetical protein n=1 Tax=unclassified Microcoleus TaxID=2642155 RepID=UPI001D982590|nr:MULTISPECIES: hypothetical protein [unclassified Microcoleus]MCC3482536.1 hypothetical protein [Microcoleus sp. PH2017_12_PCY_D_A]TAE80694.1 MAG: hypothetical protein EAZ83_17605 [Oscillatoriales cyanobacterium]MCC3409945.1 hypothetical protein [Microcoleus sp. PH2017_10_PVI_O_A]MCC3530227.1 hypothetical protein [Microcoleus sp. PH2017_21_RUC_O_A]TAF18201.1 MAG: hypothetical protein EAZ73_18900 [Oscillatoriales cyanobacterium]